VEGNIRGFAANEQRGQVSEQRGQVSVSRQHREKS
jgi:hypothetical protein